MKMAKLIIQLAIACFAFSSCEKDDTPVSLPSEYYFPPLTGNTWETIDPTELNWDLQKLNETIDFVGENNSTAFIILYKGRIVVEKYWLLFNRASSARIFSSTKSIGGFLVGLAQEQGKLNINDKVNKYLSPGWSGASAAQEAAITIKHLISMNSGLNEDLSYDTMPGTRWVYNTPAYHKLYEILAAAYGKSNDAYTNEQLWSKIGMQDASWSTETGGGPTMSCSGRDMARFGLLIAANGDWNGTAVMKDKQYFNQMINTSQSDNPAYGYLWWLNGKANYVLPTGTRIPGSLVPAAPADLVSALGYGDKKIYVSKSLDLVVIRHGAPSNYPIGYALSSFDNEIWGRLIQAVK